MTELLLVVLTLLPNAVDMPGAPTATEYDVLVRRAHLPVMIERTRRRGSCPHEELDPSDVALRVDGRRLRVTAIDAKPQPRTHALLLDTSQSMSGRIEAAKRAAMDYIDGLPEEDAVLLASFDETLVLRGPLGMDRETIKRRVESLRLGYSTSLWDALHSLALYLDTVRGEKVVILLSDGNDSSSVDSAGARTLALVRQLPDLVVFPIGIALRSSADPDCVMARSQLAGLARLTGGRFFETQTAAGLPRTFREIRKRLEERVFLSYVPESQSTSMRLRDQRIRAGMRKGIPCKIRVLGPPQFEGRRRTALSTAPPPPEHEASWVGTIDTRQMLVGRVNDLTLDRGPLYTAQSIREGKPRVIVDRVPVFTMRDFTVLTPPLREVVHTLNAPEKLLLYLLEHAPCSSEPIDDEPHTRPAWMVHGQTLIHMRTSISRALYDEHADYRDRAQEGIERAVSHRLNSMARTVPEVRVLPPAGLAHLRQAIGRQEADPELGAVPGLLTEWLGDLAARDVALTLEQMTVNVLLGSSDVARDRDPQALAAIVLDRWHRLREWFPPAISARVVAPLVPAYSPERDVIGFYRFVLPRPRPDVARIDAIPPRPLALLTVLWLGREELLGRFDDAPPHVLAVDYRPVQDLELLENACPSPDRQATSPTSKVRIDLGRAPDQPVLSLVAYFHEDRTDPSCLAVGDMAVAGPEALEAATSLRTALAEGGHLLDSESLVWQTP